MDKKIYYYLKEEIPCTIGPDSLLTPCPYLDKNTFVGSGWCIDRCKFNRGGDQGKRFVICSHPDDAYSDDKCSSLNKFSLLVDG